VERFLEEQEPVEEDDEDEQVPADEESEVAAPKRKGGGGFSCPCALSQPLQAFLGEEMLARSEVGPSPNWLLRMIHVVIMTA
jgi:hypothetical protein